MKPIIIGTRGSPLALAQTELIKDLLRVAHPAVTVEFKIIKTSGDIFQTASLTKGAGKGLFTKEIEDQLLAGTIDLAVHSLKDLPTILPDGLTVGATTKREDAHDLLVTKQPVTLASLPQGAVVASSSIRRRSQLLAARPDLRIEEIRGNVETRLRKLVENDAWSATVLAAAGLNRLGIRPNWPQLHWQPIEFDVMIPAVGQGAIACEVRSDDFTTQEVLAAINDADTLACTEAERVFLRALGGGCQVPYAAHATVIGNQMRLIAGMFDPDGTNVRRTEISGNKDDAHELGERAASQVLTSR
jgi:hydroxymethylbilane synthase